MNFAIRLAVLSIAFLSVNASASEFVVTKLDDAKSNELYDLFEKTLEKSDDGKWDIEEIILRKKNKVSNVDDKFAEVVYKKKIGASSTIKTKKLTAAETEKLKAILASYSKLEENRLAKIYKIEGLKCMKGAKADCSVIEK